MTKDEALNMAIELAERFLEYDGISTSDYIDVSKACKEALKQPSQEPVAFTNADELQELKDGMTTCYMYKERLNADCIPLYTKEQL
jgi:hypothetical protein